MKTAKALLRILTLTLGLAVQAQSQFNYTVTNGTITITGYTGPGGAVIIPSSINGLPVTTIGVNAFAYNSSLTSVTIPNSVTSIGIYAFYRCYSLAGVTIPNSVTTIGDFAFWECDLRSVTIPNSVTTIGIAAFQNCPLTSVMIPNSVATIGGGAFWQCTSLTNVTIGNSVTNIGNGAFDQCSSLTAITVDALNSFYSSVDGVLFNKELATLIFCPQGKAGTYTIPNSVISIGDSAFASCTSLTSVAIPDSVTNIGGHAFQGSSRLTSATIGNGVTSIGDGAFGECQGLTTVTIGNSVTSIGYHAFESCSSLTHVYFQGNSPTSLGSDVFDVRIIQPPPFPPIIIYDPATIYYLPGTTGWGPTFGDRPTALWNPQAQTRDPSFGVGANGFGFTITGTANIPILIEACTNFASPVWVSLQTCTLTNGSLYFSDPQWTNYPARFYRIRSP